jgi:hypothetical protein
MIGLGLGALAHANWHANFMSWENKYWPQLSVIQATHAAEILIKARIAQEHPLLIFEQIPKSSQVPGNLLEFQDLIERGRTFQYLDLPELLWATTGLRLPNEDRYKEFGRLRNALQHFASPRNVDLSLKTIEFIYEVIDPSINQWWGLFAIDYNEDHEPYVYLIENLVRHSVLFLVSPVAANDFQHLTLEWPEGKPDYRAEVEGRFAEAIRTSQQIGPEDSP